MRCLAIFLALIYFPVLAGNHYTLEVAIPLAAIGMTAKENMIIRGDIGFISADPDGKVNTARTYG